MSFADVRELLYTKRIRPRRVVEAVEQGSDAAELAAIEADLDRADDLLSTGQWQSAADAFLQVRSRAHALVNGGRGGVVTPGLATPDQSGQQAAFVRAAATLLGHLTPARVVASTVDVGTDDGVVARSRSLGLHASLDLTKSADRTRAGLAAAAAGRYGLAATEFRAAVESATPPERAALQLNLGVALLQTGRLDEAENVLTLAERSFTRAEDTIGSAQAQQNLAVLRATQGQSDKARDLFTAAQDKAKAAAGNLAQAARVVGELGLRDGMLSDLVTKRAEVVPGDRAHAATGSLTADPSARAINALSARGAPSLTSVRGGAIDDLGAGLMLVLRDPADATAFLTTALVADFAHPSTAEVTAGFSTANQVRTLSWVGTNGPAVDDLVARLYEPRMTATTLVELVWAPVTAVDTAARLAHMQYFETVLGLGDAYAGMADWGEARSLYLLAAGYDFLNSEIEAPLLWHKIAETYLGEGDEHYRDDDLQGATDAYANVLDPTHRTAPVPSPLYQHAALSPTGALVPALMDNPAAAPEGLGSGTAAVVLDVAQRLTQISAGLDWFGVPATFVPPFTFEHLQNAARYLAQQAKYAERDYIQFTERYEQSTMSKAQLHQAATSAQAELGVVKKQRDAAHLEVTVTEHAQKLADKRAADAQQARTKYAAMSSEQVGLETDIAWYSSQNSWELDKTLKGSGPDAGRHIHEVVSERRHRLGVISRDYELLRMQQNSVELGIASTQAAAQTRVSQARAAAADLAVHASALRVNQASQLAALFDSQTFTPEVWWQLARYMRQYAARYLGWATKVARLMERVYEFEHDVTVDRIRTYYGGEVAGLLGADELSADIDYFTYLQIMETDYRPQRVTTSVSLAERFPFAFQTELRTTGSMTFDLSLADIEAAHPGTFNQRVRAVEVRVIGPVPVEGLHGTLRNSGFSRYRSRDGGTKTRIQDVDVLVLSAYERGDVAMFRRRPEMLDVFEGTGLASTWTIELPLNNDIDFAFVVDVELTFHYEAGFDRQLETLLRSAVLPPEATRATTSFSLRWDLPDRFFVLQSTGVAELEIGLEYLPHQHLDPQVRSVSVQLLGADGPLRTVVDLSVGAPGVSAVAVRTDTDGRVASDDPALGALTGHPVLGTWPVSLPGDPDVRDAIHDVLLFVEYDYRPRGA